MVMVIGGKSMEKDDENLDPVPQLATDEAPPLSGGEKENPLRPKGGKENMKADNYRWEEREQAKPGDLFLFWLNALGILEIVLILLSTTHHRKMNQICEFDK